MKRWCACQGVGLAVLRRSSNQAFIIDLLGKAEVAARKRAQVGQDTVLESGTVLNETIRCWRIEEVEAVWR